MIATLILSLTLTPALPQAPPLLTVAQAPPLMDCQACDHRPPQPPGDGWQWDEKGGHWWRPVTPMARPPLVTFPPRLTPSYAIRGAVCGPGG